MRRAKSKVLFRSAARTLLPRSEDEWILREVKVDFYPGKVKVILPLWLRAYNLSRVDSGYKLPPFVKQLYKVFLKRIHPLEVESVNLTLQAEGFQVDEYLGNSQHVHQMILEAVRSYVRVYLQSAVVL
jgi:hypothetical protein